MHPPTVTICVVWLLLNIMTTMAIGIVKDGPADPGSDYAALVHALVEINGDEVAIREGLPLPTKRRELFVNDVNVSLALPQDDPDPSSRNLTLMNIQSRLRNYPRSWSYNKVAPSLYYGRGPLPIPGTLGYDIIMSELETFTANRASLATFSGLASSVAAQNISTLKDIAQIYTKLNTTLFPVPETLSNWNSNAVFGEYRKSYSGWNLRRIRRPYFSVPITAKQRSKLLGAGRSFASLARNGLLYGSDLTEVYQYSHGPMKYLPGSMTMFGPNAKGAFVPLAIKLHNGLVYTRFDTSGEWTLAKLAVNVGEVVWTGGYHFLTTHIVLEPIRVELIRHLSARHPVYQLLQYHLRTSSGLALAGMLGLFSNGTNLDRITGWGAEGWMEYYSNKSATLGADFGYTFEKEIKDRDVGDLLGFRQLQDMRALMRVIRTFVREFLEGIYGGKHASILADYELQAWAQGCNDPSGGGVKNFPISFRNMRDLEDAIVHILWLIEVKHHASNSNTIWLGGARPGYFGAFWKPLPSVKGIHIIPREWLAPNASILAAEFTVAYSFYHRSRPIDTLLKAYTNMTAFGPAVSAAAQRYYNGMLGVEAAINNRESHPQLFKYEAIKPSISANWLLI